MNRVNRFSSAARGVRLLRCSSQLSAFTLIELLVVVSIIAILGTIALVNMQNAQARSKVSRTKADLRTLASALESYATDAGAYPICNGYGLALSRPSIPGDPPVLEGLTTPVAYISSLPETAFPPKRISGNFINGVSAPNTDVSQWPGIPFGGPDKHLYSLYQYTSAAASETAISGVERVTADGAQRTASVFLLQCSGPMQGHINLGGVIANASRADSTDLIYDPTNGTPSFGNLFRTAGSAPREDNFLSATIEASAAR